MTSPSEDGAIKDNANRRLALARYADMLESLSAPAPLDGLPFPYDACPLIKEVVWRTSPLIADFLVDGELRELTNTLNEWRGALRRWHVWLAVLDEFSAEDAWSLQWEFVESLAFHGLFYPSATRDRFTFVATNALHQVRMAADAAYPDRLAADPKPGKEDKPRFMPRKDSEAQLEVIVSTLEGGASLVSTLRSLDEDDYLELTKNFRNLASHAIAPRLSVGITNTVVRRVARRRSLSGNRMTPTRTSWCLASSRSPTVSAARSRCRCARSLRQTSPSSRRPPPACTPTSTCSTKLLPNYQNGIATRRGDDGTRSRFSRSECRGTE